MTRGRFVIRGGALVRIEDAAPLFQPGPASDLACPMVIGDTIEATQSMADGRFYTSKRAISAATRRAGLTEVGTEKMPARQRAKPSRRAIKDTVEKASARFNRGERVSPTPRQA